MPTTYKVLGQVKPSAVTLTTLYTVPSATSAVVSTIQVANLNATADYIRIAIRPAGESVDDKHFISYNEVVGGNSNFSFTIGVTLATTDVISVYSVNGTSSFSAFGSEIA
jgi:hypothetical protein